jgi:phage replication O-like protein O
VASPQLEHGYTPVANELLEAILRADLSARELKVVMAVARETYGWSRKATTVTGYRLAQMTGMQRTQAARALKTLKFRNILSNGSEGIGLQKDYHVWQRRRGSKMDRVQVGPGSNPDHTTGSSSDPKKGSRLNPPIKQENKKARTKKAIAPVGDGYEAVQLYCDGFRARYGRNPTVSGKTAGIITRLRKRLGEADYRVCIARYFADDDRFLVRVGHTAEMLENRVNALLVQTVAWRDEPAGKAELR